LVFSSEVEISFVPGRESANSEECNVVRPALGTRTRFSNRRLAEDLKGQPRFDLPAAADDFISWMKEHHAN
jgi:hypothetical protein